MRRDSFSYQRNAGMSQLLPSSRPAWLAPVCEERSHSQPSRRCEPSDSQRAIVGACPSRSASRSIPSPRPSISNRIVPGTSRAVVPARVARAAADDAQLAGVPADVEQRRRRASRSRPARTRSPGWWRTAVRRRRSGRRRARPTPALSTSEASPKVRIVSGSATRVSSGHSSALISAIAAATSRAASKERACRPGSTLAPARAARGPRRRA